MKILFVDVDGVLIPASQAILDPLCFLNRNIPDLQLAMLTRICETSDAKVVMNTTHNLTPPDKPSIHEVMIRKGFDAKHFHPVCNKTEYPHISRKLAVRQWIREHGKEIDMWLCVDDTICADDQHMVHVDSEVGITISNMNTILTTFGHNPILIFV